MNHDYAHCIDQTKNCPKNCFRRQLNDDLKHIEGYGIGWISWVHFKDTDECELRKEMKTCTSTKIG